MMAMKYIHRRNTLTDDIFITVEQVAERLQVHPATVTRYINDGRLEAIQIGRNYRIHPEAFNRFVEQQKVETVKGAESPC
jgi:excisionase family DNA binding protein